MEMIELSNQKFQLHNIHEFEFRIAGIFQFWNDFQLWRGKIDTYYEYHVCIETRDVPICFVCFGQKLDGWM